MIFKNPSELLNKINSFEINTSIFDLAIMEWYNFDDMYNNTEFIILDTETTGLVWEIIDLGAVTVKWNKIRMKNWKFESFDSAIKHIHDVDFFGYLIFPKPIIKNDGSKKYVIPELITELTHIDLDLLYNNLNSSMPNKSSYDFVGCFDDFIDYVGCRPMVAHNFKFDIWRIKDALWNIYLRETYERIDHEKLNNFLSLATIDTLKDAKKILKVNDVKNHKNSILAGKYWVEANNSMLHRAYYDTFFTWSVFFWLLHDAKNVFNELDSIVTNINTKI